MSSRSSSRLTVGLAQYLISTGRVKKHEIALYCHALAVAGEERWSLNAFTKIFSRDFIMEQSDRGGPLAGIPISVKANLAVRDSPLTASSKIMGCGSSCGYDSHVVSKLKTSGAIIIGVTQMDEFGMGSLGINVGEGSQFYTKNPLPYCNNAQRSTQEWIEKIQMPYDDIIDDHKNLVGKHLTWSAGGSSCGSAASVAHGSSLLSVASDTGGSIRLPAAWCGVVGFKPTYGYIPRKGLMSYASSLDTIGILAPSAECIATAMKNLQPEEETKPIVDSTRLFHANKVDLKVMGNTRIGIPSAFSVDDSPKYIRDSWHEAAVALEEKGATLVEISSDLLSPELIRASLAAYYIIASAEACSNLSRYDGVRFGLSTDGSRCDLKDYTELEHLYAATRSQGFGREVLRRILGGTYVLSSDRFHTHYEAATKIRAAVSHQLVEVLKTVDVILMPSSLSFPDNSNTDPTAMFANDVLTIPISLACLPAISVPWQSGAPIGLQISGLSHDKILSIAMDIGIIAEAAS